MKGSGLLLPTLEPGRGGQAELGRGAGLGLPAGSVYGVEGVGGAVQGLG